MNAPLVYRALFNMNIDEEELELICHAFKQQKGGLIFVLQAEQKARPDPSFLACFYS